MGLDGKRVLNSSGWSGWSSMSGVDYIYNSPRVSDHAVIYRSSSAGSGEYYDRASLEVGIYVDPNSSEGYISWCNTDIICELYDGDPVNGGSYIGRESTGVVYVDVSMSYWTFSFSNISCNRLYFMIYCNNEDDSVCRVQSDASKADLTTHKPPKRYLVTTTGDFGVTSTLPGSASIEEGASVTLSCVLKNRWTFVGWYEGSELIGTTQTYVFTNVRAAHNFVAKASPPTTYLITIGETEFDYCFADKSSGGEYEFGSEVELMCTFASQKYRFEGWFKDDETVTPISTSMIFTFQVPDPDDVEEGENPEYECTLTPTVLVGDLILTKNGAVDRVTEITNRQPVGTDVLLDCDLSEVPSDLMRVDFLGWYEGDVHGDYDPDKLVSAEKQFIFEYPISSSEHTMYLCAVAVMVDSAAVYIERNSQWDRWEVYVFSGNSWKRIFPYIYNNGEWMFAT